MAVVGHGFGGEEHEKIGGLAITTKILCIFEGQLNVCFMGDSESTLFSVISKTFCRAVEKASAEEMSLTDMYVQVKYDEQLFSVFDDTENVLAQATIEELEEWHGANDDENSNEALIVLLKKVLAQESVDKALHSLDIIPPFSVVLVDGAMEPVADLVTLDDENVYLHDDFWEKMDKELDDFFEELMSDTK